MMDRAISEREVLAGERISLRLVGLADCTERYVAWLADPEVNRFLETRWSEQTLESIRDFVGGMLASADSYLFAIVENASALHIGNIKIGPIHSRHSYADVSYFIGERNAWGKGYGTDAVRGVTKFGFERLGLNRCQAGVYASNVGSIRVLEKAGYALEGSLKRQLRSDSGFQDHLYFGALRDSWT